MVLVVWVVIAVELHRQLGNFHLAHQVQNRNLHLALVQVCRLVLDDLDSADGMCAHVLALDDLAESALAQYIENEIAAVSSRSSPSHS